ncbi:DUF945 family protein [Oceanimonas sp. CHS3-5]|uniref:DUF945 family protein n=1 Tax=Oceanimonas sp. CHS3-5 TaxID=3068186 RepID=UPI00273E877D|nr:DUF945 family protein [Oceanimonas sp. CHS3-5]MDP5291994.1 DUF945 family protein [Oceanimonas sp. CHS3-5]
MLNETLPEKRSITRLVLNSPFESLSGTGSSLGPSPSTLQQLKTRAQDKKGYLMKTKKIAAAVAAVTVVGFVGINQAGYKGQVKAGVDNIIEQLNDARLFGEEINAELASHDGGVFSSNGVITVKAGSDYRPTEFRINYTVAHGLTTVLGGASYEAEIINSVMDGNDEKTLTSVLLNDQPVIINGSLGSDSIDGTLTVPAIEFSEGRGGLEAKPIIAEFYASNFNEYGSPGLYEVQASVPLIKFKDRREGFELTDGVLELTNEFDGEKGNGEFSLELNKLTVINEGYRRDSERVEVKDLAIAMDLDLQEEFSSNLSLQFDELNANGDSLSDVEVSYSLAGIDGASIVDVIKMTQKAAKEDWSEYRLQQSIEGALRERADSLLAYNPKLEINRIKAKMNGDLLIDAEGIAKLDSSKLPKDFLKSAFEYNRAPNPQEFIKAILVDFEAELGKSASDMASTINPMAAAILSESGDKFTFKIEDGETTMNGERI